MPYEMFCTAHPSKLGGRVDFSDTRDCIGRPCNGADGRALTVYVVNPYLSAFDQFLCFNSSLVQGHGEVNLKLEFNL